LVTNAALNLFRPSLPNQEGKKANCFSLLDSRNEYFAFNDFVFIRKEEKPTPLGILGSVNEATIEKELD